MVIPPQGRESVLTELHSGHPGVSRMKLLARGLVWWLGMEKSIEIAVKHSASCQQNQESPPQAPLHPWSWPTRPWIQLHVDYAGPVEGEDAVDCYRCTFKVDRSRAIDDCHSRDDDLATEETLCPIQTSRNHCSR